MVVAVSPLMTLNIFASNVFADNNVHKHTPRGEGGHQDTVFITDCVKLALVQML